MFCRVFAAGLAVLASGMISAGEAQTRLSEDSATAQNDTWVPIGETAVDLAKDTVTIDVGQGKGAVKALRLESKRGRIEISGIEVRYGGGKVHEERRTFRLAPGRSTTIIDKLAEDRFVERVTLTYKPQRNSLQSGLIRVVALQSPTGAQAGRQASAADPSAPPPLPPAVGGEVLFGAQQVGFSVDRDIIRVGEEIGKFDRIRLRVLDNNIFLNELRVVYVAGEPDIIVVNAEVKKNLSSRWFSLNGDRFIKEVQLIYRTQPPPKRGAKNEARVEVYGEYADSWIGPQGAAVKHNKGWVYLGARTASSVGARKGSAADKDVVLAGRNRGGFNTLRLDVKGRTITLNDVRIVYEGGTSDVIAVKNKVDAGASYGPITVKPHPIKDIQVNYRPRMLDGGKGPAVVEFWGQH